MAKTFQNRQLPEDVKIKNSFELINLNAGEVNADLSELYLKDTNNVGRINSHVNGTAEKHAAGTITFIPNGSVSATETQSAIEQVDERVSNIIASSGTSDTETVDARNSSKFGMFMTLKNRNDFSDEVIAKHTAQLADIAVNVKTFGAKGDGVNDDTQAFRDANLYAYNKARISAGQHASVAVNSMKLFIPAGVYRVKGTKIFGSPVAEGVVGTTPPIMFSCIGNDVTILWDLDSVDDELFYFDGTIDNPKVEGLTITPVSENNTIVIGGTIFKYYNDAVSLGYAHASKGHYKNITVVSGRSKSNYNFSTKPKFIFKSMGYGMSDQTLVENCEFTYFETCFYNENSESVNWTFSECGFFAGGFTDSVYFDFTRMHDNFNVVNCSFAVSDSETLIKTRSTLSGGLFTQTAHFNFNIKDSRIEMYGEAGSTWKLCDMNFGRLNLSGINLRLSAGQNVKTFVDLFGLANINFENVVFNPVEFRLPILTTESLIGVASGYGAYLKNCDFQPNDTTFKYYDGVTVYALKDLIPSYQLFKHLKVENCTLINTNGFYDFEIVNSITGMAVPSKHEKVFSFSTNGVAFGNTYKLPPYQAIKKITLNLPVEIPTSFSKFRVYIGDKSLGNYFDVENIKPDIDQKNDLVLFEGTATVFTENLDHQSITVYVMNDAVESGGITSEITVSLCPLDPRVFGITTNADVVKIRHKVKVSAGSTAYRPDFGLIVGQFYFDTNLNKPIWWNGSAWKDAAGTTV